MDILSTRLADRKTDRPLVCRRGCHPEAWKGSHDYAPDLLSLPSFPLLSATPTQVALFPQRADGTSVPHPTHWVAPSADSTAEPPTNPSDPAPPAGTAADATSSWSRRSLASSARSDSSSRLDPL